MTGDEFVALLVSHYIELWWAWCYVMGHSPLLAAFGTRFVVSAVLYVARVAT